MFSLSLHYNNVQVQLACTGTHCCEGNAKLFGEMFSGPEGYQHLMWSWTYHDLYLVW